MFEIRPMTAADRDAVIAAVDCSYLEKAIELYKSTHSDQ